jgi:hypothetical protein
VAAPSWLRLLTLVGSNFHGDKRKFRHPYVRAIDGGAPTIDYAEIFCDAAAPGCRRAGSDPTDREMVAATIAVLDEITSIAGRARLVVAYIWGPDDDPVVRALHGKGITVVDIRSRPGFNESDSSLPFDAHPGPLSQMHFFLKLAAGLEAKLAAGSGRADRVSWALRPGAPRCSASFSG